MNAGPIIAAFLLPIALWALIGEAVYLSSVRRRLKPVEPRGQVRRERASAGAREWLVGALASVVGRMMRRDYLKAVDTALQRAGVASTAQEYVGVLAFGAVASAGAGLVLGKGSHLFLLLGAWAWVTANLSVLAVRQRVRSARFTEQLPNALDIASNALRTGYGFIQAMGLVAEEGSPPISTEFRRVVREIGVGIPLEEALNGMLSRIGTRDLELVVVAVLLNRQVGGNLAELIDTISGTVRERARMRGELKALTATGRLSGSVVALMPFAMGGLLWLVRREYMETLFTTAAGRFMLTAGGIAELIGIIVIYRIVNIAF